MALADRPSKPTVGRRAFLGGSAAASALAALNLNGVRGVAFAQSNEDGDVETSSTVQERAESGPDNSDHADNIVLTVFLRGGADFLNLVVPSDDDDRGHYEQARPQLQIPATELLDIDGIPFGFHPAAAGLHQMFDDGNLALVQGAGLTADTRSHFDAMAIIERGAASTGGPGSGWLARHLATSETGDGLVPALAMGGVIPTSFLTSNDVLTLSSLDGFAFPSQFNPWVGAQRGALRRLYSSGQTQLHRAGLKALDGSNVIELRASGGQYEPRRGVTYPQGAFADQLQTIAQVIKADLGLHSATIDLGGWDTHGSQGNGSAGTFATLVEQLSGGLAAFVDDLDEGPGARSFLERTTIVVISEFGRRVVENAAAGTDHGHGGNIFVLGGEVNGGVYGQFPGLDVEQRYDSADVAVSTDYRQVISEIVVRRMGNPNLGAVFPGYDTYEPLGLVAGSDLEPDFGALEADAEAEVAAPPAVADAQDGEDESEVAAGPGDGSDFDIIPFAGLGTGAALVGGVAAVGARRRRRKASEAAKATPIEARLYDEHHGETAPTRTDSVIDLDKPESARIDAPPPPQTADRTG